MSEIQAGYPIRPLPFTQARIDDSFWQPRIDTAARVTVPYDFQKCEETGRIANFDKAAGTMPGAHEGIYYNDSDVFKVVEGAAYALQVAPDAEMQSYVDSLIAKFAAALELDGDGIPVDFQAIPYYAWGYRGAGQMTVWLKRA